MPPESWPNAAAPRVANEAITIPLASAYRICLIPHTSNAWLSA
jgi:hypothetical protein